MRGGSTERERAIDPLAFFSALAAAAAVSAAATPLFALYAKRIGLVVRPRSDRWHRTPTPLLGGAAIALAAVGVFGAVAPLGGPARILLFCAALAFALGLLDDFRHLAPTTKLVGQVLVASVLAFGGIHVEVITFAPLAFMVTVFWVVGVMNALNLLDNMDGLAAGVTAIAATALGLTALEQNSFAALVAAITAGAALGFLVHNSSPARVFMGDGGSLLLGFLLAAVALLHTARSAANLGLAVLGPLAVLALPIFDTALVATSRRLAGIPVSQGGRDHASHRLAALGLSDRAAVLVLYGITGAFAALGLFTEAVSAVVVPVLVIAAVGLVLFGIFLHEVDVYGRAASQRTTQTPLQQSLLVYARFGAEVGLDVALLTTAYYVSYVIRFEGAPQSAWMYLFVPSLPVVVALQLGALVVLGVYRTLWRYLSINDAVVIVRAVAAGTAMSALGILLLFRFQDYSRAVLLLDALLSVALLIGSRSFLLWLRHVFASRPRDGQRRVLIVGANDGGALALRLLNRAGETAYRPVGFLDDDPGKRYRRVDGVPIVGRLEDLARTVESLRADLVVVALDRDDPDTERVRELCGQLGVEYRDFLVPV